MDKCLDVYKNINIEFIENKLRISPCCIYPAELADNLDFNNNTLLTEVRRQWDNNIVPTGCQSCVDQKEANQHNRMEDSNKWYAAWDCADTKLELIRMDYHVGDVCNLACLICGPRVSSKWKEELNWPIETRKQTVNAEWDKLDLSTIRYIHFTGGEPLLSKEHILLLEAIPNKSLVEIAYNTNGTILPSLKLLYLWSKFLKVCIAFSIDDIGERFEYQRYPARWYTVASNIQWFIENCPVNCLFEVNTTVSILNQFNLDKLDNWLTENFPANRVTDKTIYRKQPAHGILAIDNTNFNTIVAYLDKCDLRRGLNWRHTFPELIDILSPM